MLRKSLGSKHSGNASLSNNVHEPTMHLDADHEETPDARSNNIGSLTTGCRSGIPYTRDPFSKLIAE